MIWYNKKRKMITENQKNEKKLEITIKENDSWTGIIVIRW